VGKFEKLPGCPIAVVDIASAKATCRACSFRRLCLPLGLSPDDLQLLEAIVKRSRPIPRGKHIFRVGDQFRAVYSVRSGSIKTYIMTESGAEQVTGFHLPGELFGFDGLATGSHPCGAKTLEMASVCELQFTELEELTGDIHGLRHQLLKLMSKEILDEGQMLTLLGKHSADERLAALLYSLSTRFKVRGFSGNEFRLSMSRNDIADYLGLAVETVSRLFTRFQRQQLVEVENKDVRILDPAGLKALAGHLEEPRKPSIRA
jgi:CRP/FNR family transcriptional regulator